MTFEETWEMLEDFGFKLSDHRMKLGDHGIWVNIDEQDSTVGVFYEDENMTMHIWPDLEIKYGEIVNTYTKDVKYYSYDDFVDALINNIIPKYKKLKKKLRMNKINEM